MFKTDQEMRNNSIKDPTAWDAEIDRKHTKRLKDIISQYGWPTISLAGPEASNAAWLIAQHADHDRGFQKQCLELMKQLPSDEVNLRNIAYLEDRIRVAGGRPQLYGTQFDRTGKRFGPSHVKDKRNLDKRRKAMGLQPFEEYRKIMTKYYGGGS